MKIAQFYDDFLDVQFYALVGKNEAEADEWFTKHGCEGLATDKQNDEGNEGYCVIWATRRKTNSSKTFCGIFLREGCRVNDLVYELVHATFNVFTRKQVTISNRNDETFARYLDKLTYQLLYKKKILRGVK